MGSTPNWDIYYLENGDPQSQITESSVQAGTVEAALDQVGGNVESVNNFGVRYFANASARDLALTNPEVGWLTQLDSELFMRRWDGVRWVPYGSTSFRIRPTTVSGAGVSVEPDGTIRLSSSPSLIVDGVFDNDTLGYQIDWDFTRSASSSATLRFRSGGVTDETTNTPRQWSYATGTSTTTGYDNQNFTGLTPTFTGRAAGSLKITRQSNSAARMLLVNSGGVSADGSSAYNYWTSSIHSTTAPRDGFILIPGGVNLTGIVRVSALS